MKKRSLHRLIALPLVAAALTWSAQANAAGCGSGSYYQDNTQYNQGSQPTPGYPTGNVPGAYQQQNYQQGYPQQNAQPGYQGQQYQQGQSYPNYNQGGSNQNYQGGYNQGSTYGQTSYANDGRGNGSGNGSSGSYWDKSKGDGSSIDNPSNRTYRNSNNNGYGDGSSRALNNGSWNNQGDGSSRALNNGSWNNQGDGSSRALNNGSWNNRGDGSSLDRGWVQGDGSSNDLQTFGDGSSSDFNSDSSMMQNQSGVPGQSMMQNQGSGTVLEMIANNPQYSTFNKLIQASPEFLNSLKSGGPYTVFAPTNAAFNKLSSSKLQDLTKPENRDKLRKVLAYHVVSGKYMTSDFKGDLKTLNGDSLDISVDKNGVSIDKAKIVQPNIVASNGVIQGVDTVLMP